MAVTAVRAHVPHDQFEPGSRNSVHGNRLGIRSIARWNAVNPQRRRVAIALMATRRSACARAISAQCTSRPEHYDGRAGRTSRRRWLRFAGHAASQRSRRVGSTLQLSSVECRQRWRVSTPRFYPPSLDERRRRRGCHVVERTRCQRRSFATRDFAGTETIASSVAFSGTGPTPRSPASPERTPNSLSRLLDDDGVTHRGSPSLEAGLLEDAVQVPSASRRQVCQAQ